MLSFRSTNISVYLYLKRKILTILYTVLVVCRAQVAPYAWKISWMDGWIYEDASQQRRVCVCTHKRERELRGNRATKPYFARGVSRYPPPYVSLSCIASNPPGYCSSNSLMHTQLGVVRAHWLSALHTHTHKYIYIYNILSKDPHALHCVCLSGVDLLFVIYIYIWIV